ncbi:SDR family oxidoreductase [Maritalea mediterranea]|uniref:SDR family oxidoreductase n=1 Tax=Maritalea mediterranea TaxID=2909667 RepID=A0ABS9EDA7_9HYPH|nr:SDR family oxidoreductase [Maritalea mediterranea]MCF4099869.1 SDR family oxidoreductase [Maritalea mediterranea]
MTKTVVITGANRGIGLELVKRYLADENWHVIAACRAPDKAVELKQMIGSSSKRLSMVALDVVDSASVLRLQQELDGATIDVLINNAGIFNDRDSQFGALDYDKWMESFNVNVLGPMRVAEALEKPLMRAKAPKIVTISSQMGALNRNATGSFAYRSSKAAVNKAMQTLANQLEDTKAIVTLFHPGWVQTDMGGSNAEITPSESADGLFKTIAGLTKADSGKFLKWNGDVHPW